jgi:hypothetical protein
MPDGRRPSLLGVVVAGLTIAVSAVGCQNQGQTWSWGGTQTPKRIVAGPALDPPDVPVPTGFKPVEDRSSDQSSGSIRNVWHEYRGRSDRAALRNFYREQMASYRWVLVSDQNIKGEVTLRYEKGDEECVVMIRPVWNILDQTLIRVTITRLERGGTPTGRARVPGQQP